MAKNTRLENAVLKAMVGYILKVDKPFERITAVDKEFALHIAAQTTSISVDKPHEVEIVGGRVSGHGYDLTGKDEHGTPAQELYQKALQEAKTVSERMNGQRLVAEGTIEDRIGWYITATR